MDGLRSFIVLPVVLLLNQVDFTNPNIAQLFIAGYVGILVLSALSLLYVYTKINKENVENVEIITEASMGKPSQKMTQKEYDMSQLKVNNHPNENSFLKYFFSF